MDGSFFDRIKKHLVASGLATAVAEIATLPICTSKINYQNANGLPMKIVIKNIWNKYGILGFYNATGWAFGSQIISSTSKYTFYQALKEYIDNKFIAGAGAGALSSLFTHPIDVIKIHKQMNTLFLPELKRCGPLVLYRGYNKSLAKALLGSTFFYPLYDIFNKYTNNPVIASMLSAIISTIIIQPADYMKTRQVYGQPFFSGYHPAPYFKGLSLNLMRIVPHFMITMTLIESFKKRNLLNFESSI